MTALMSNLEETDVRREMKSNSKKFSVSSALKKIRNGSMDLDPEYQRGAVWGRARKALLVDSMLRGYDLPRICLRETPNSRESYEVVDGVQRLTAMDDFARGEFSLPKSSAFSGFRYHQLPESVQEEFDDYQLDLAVLEDCTDEEVRDYATAKSHSSDQSVSIQVRHEFLLAAMRSMLEVLPAKYNQRQFRTPDRVTAWYRAGGLCEASGCSKTVSFGDFHADHQKAWSRGGTSSLDNLQVLCPAHNLAKGVR